MLHDTSITELMQLSPVNCGTCDMPATSANMATISDVRVYRCVWFIYIYTYVDVCVCVYIDGMLYH